MTHPHRAPELRPPWSVGNFRHPPVAVAPSVGPRHHDVTCQTRTLARRDATAHIRPYGRTGLPYRKMSVGCSGTEQSHMRKEAGHERGYYTRGTR